MSFLLDTNIVSEWVKPRPNPGVATWLHEADEDRVFLSVASLAEIRRGIELLTPGRRRDLLTAWLAEDLPMRFEGRILDIERRIAEAWGIVMAHGKRAGLNTNTLDAFIAATVEVHGLTLVTHNVRHFEHLGIPWLDPWQPDADAGPATPPPER